jgi:nitrogen fixation protein FixH
MKETNKKDRALRWPYGIALSFILIITLIFGTIAVSLDYPVEKSDMNMQNYHVYDKHVNEFIQKRIDFDKSYTLEYVAKPITMSNTVVSYKLTDKAGNAVNNATIQARLTRPNEHKYNLDLKDPKIEDGIYTFEAVTLPKEGRWNILAAISIGEHSRYLNLKADTRETDITEY